MPVNGEFDAVAAEQFKVVIAGVGCMTGSSVLLQAMQMVIKVKAKKNILMTTYSFLLTRNYWWSWILMNREVR